MNDESFTWKKTQYTSLYTQKKKLKKEYNKQANPLENL